MDYNKYMNVDDLAAMEEMARIDDPQARIDSLGGLQGLASGMRSKGPKERDNGRVVGAISPLETIGGIAQNAAGAFMNKSLADKYGGILDANNAARGTAAKNIVNALRRTKNPAESGFDSDAYMSAYDEFMGGQQP